MEKEQTFKSINMMYTKRLNDALVGRVELLLLLRWSETLRLLLLRRQRLHLMLKRERASVGRWPVVVEEAPLVDGALAYVVVDIGHPLKHVLLAFVLALWVVSGRCLRFVYCWRHVEQAESASGRRGRFGAHGCCEWQRLWLGRDCRCIERHLVHVRLVDALAGGDRRYVRAVRGDETVDAVVVGRRVVVLDDVELVTDEADLLHRVGIGFGERATCNFLVRVDVSDVGAPELGADAGSRLEAGRGGGRRRRRGHGRAGTRHALVHASSPIASGAYRWWWWWLVGAAAAHCQVLLAWHWLVFRVADMTSLHEHTDDKRGGSDERHEAGQARGHECQRADAHSRERAQRRLRVALDQEGERGGCRLLVLVAVGEDGREERATVRPLGLEAQVERDESVVLLLTAHRSEWSTRASVELLVVLGAQRERVARRH